MAGIRTFIAIHTPDSIRDAMKQLQAELRQSRADVKWESADKFHATIKFLGNVEESILEKILDTMQVTAQSFPAFDVVYETLGAFPTKRRPRVVWIGCDNPDGTLNKMKEALDKALQPFGFEIEDRAFHPHVTLGRVKSPQGLSDLTPMLEKRTFEPHPARIAGISVFKSVLRPEGSVYSVLREIPLTK